MDVGRLETVSSRSTVYKPTVVVNCVGIIKQLAAAKDPVASIAVNALFPHQLARAVRARGIRLLHISTDCVFAGTRGGYREEDVTDAMDLYGRTKALGEVTGPGCVTLRTSIIGRELAGASGLVEWFLAQRGGSADGYSGAIFSGFTTIELSSAGPRGDRPPPGPDGPVSCLGGADCKVRPPQLAERRVQCGRRSLRPETSPRLTGALDSQRFRDATGYRPPDVERNGSGAGVGPDPVR